MLFANRSHLAQATPTSENGVPRSPARLEGIGRAVRFAALALVIGTALVAARGGWPARANAQATVTVSMEGNRFLPNTLTVAAGTTVVWANNDFASGEQHDVATNDGSILSDLINPGQVFVLTLSSPGEYRYYCDLHDGMFGVIFVN